MREARERYRLATSSSPSNKMLDNFSSMLTQVNRWLVGSRAQRKYLPRRSK